MQHPLVPAAVLVVAGVDLVVVGSAALMVYGELSQANDLDIVPRFTESNLGRLHVELTRIAHGSRAVDPFIGRDVVRTVTSFGVVDVLLERGLLEFDILKRRAVSTEVHGVQVRIASCVDAWRLRHQFKVTS